MAMAFSAHYYLCNNFYLLLIFTYYLCNNFSYLPTYPLPNSSFPTTTSWSDHRLITVKLSFKLRSKAPKSSAKLPKRLNVSASTLFEKSSLLEEKLDQKLSTFDAEVSDNAEIYWKKLRDTVYESSAEVLGFVKRSHQDWFDENDEGIKLLLDNLHEAHKKW